MTTRFSGRALLRPLITGAAFFLMISCGGSSSDDAAAPVAAGTCDSSQATVETATFDALYTNVFGPQCASCHGAGATGTDGGPDMTTADNFYSGLVGKKGSDYQSWNTFQNNRARCESYDFVKAGAGGASLSMLTAVLDPTVSLASTDATKNCVVKSHLDAPQSVCITSANLTKLKQWINAGAAR